MAIKIVREQRKNEDGTYDIIHPETQAKVVWMSDGRSVEEATENKQDKLIGSAGQVVGFDENGNAIAQENNALSVVTTELLRQGVIEWYDLYYENGIFFNLGFNHDDNINVAAYSTDGINWIETTLPNILQWISVCYGDGKFVAVAYINNGNPTNGAAYSVDGINWVETTLPSEQSWSSVCYGDGKFIAVAEHSNKAAYSTDGINWTETTLPSEKYWYSVCYGNGKFVAIGADENYFVIVHSTDGINWTATTLPSEREWYSFYYDNGKFIVRALSGNDYVVAHSTDGINWIETTLPSEQDWDSICYGGGKFIALAYGGNVAAYSADGINWTEATLPSEQDWDSICYGGGKFIAVAYDSDIAAYSTDGVNWTEITLPNMYLLNVCYGNGRFVISYYDNNNVMSTAYSVDGVDWFTALNGVFQAGEDKTEAVAKFMIPYLNDKLDLMSVGNISLPSAQPWSSFCYGDGKFVAVAYNSNVAAYSTDAINWTETNLTSMQYWACVCYGNGKFVAIAYGSNVAAVSTDGINWTETTMSSEQEWRSICYGDGKFVAVCSGNGASKIAAYSTDGVSWTEVAMSNQQWWTSVCYDDGKFVAVGSGARDGNIADYSTDGINWTKTNLPSMQYWTCVCYGDGKFVAIANNSNIAAYSTDGINWIKTDLPDVAYWCRVCYGDGKFVAVSYESNMVALSTDGINWTEATMSSEQYWTSVCYGDGKFVAMSEEGIIAISTDGINWTDTIISQLGVDKTEAVAKAIAPYMGKPDWNTNDETDPSYIKNRPFYSNGMVENVLVDNVSVELNEAYDNGIYGANYIPFFINLVAGNTYIVEWDGVAYECIAMPMVDGEYYGAGIGNAYRLNSGEWHNNEPFFINSWNDGWVGVATFDVDEGGTHTVSIAEKKEDIATIPIKYINDMYGEIDHENEILLDQETVDIEINEEYGYGGICEISGYIPLIEGATYMVDFNGTIYECVAWSVNGWTFIGNGSTIDFAENTGEPFCFDGEVFIILTAGTYTVSISLKKTIKKIPEKYLPDSVVTMDVLDDAMHEVAPDMTRYYTKSEVDAAIAAAIQAAFANIARAEEVAF